MAGNQFYPDVPRAPAQPDPPSRADLETRVAELERVIATIASLRHERAGDDRPDPVALTAALHPGGMRSARQAKRGSSRNGSLPLRFVLFDPAVTG